MRNLGHGEVRMENGQLRDDLSRIWCSCGNPAVSYIEESDPPFDFVCSEHGKGDENE